MNDDTQPNLTNDNAKPVKRKSGGFLKTLVLFILAAALVMVGYAYWCTQNYKVGARPDMAQIEQRLTGVENSVRDLNSRIDTLNNPQPAVSKQAAETESETQKQISSKSANDIARMQSDLVALSSALSALQNEVKESGTHMQHAQLATQNAVSSAIAYIQLRSIALTDQPYTYELTSLRDASPDDADFRKAMGRLDIYASTGAPTIQELRDDLIAQEASASQAVTQHNAQNWWQKLLAELEGLVTIRHIHGGPTDAFSAMENDLAKNDLGQALTDMKNLPPEAQDHLKDWAAKAEARRSINDALHSLSDYFSGMTKSQTRHLGTP